MDKKLLKYLRKMKKDFPLTLPVRVRICTKLVDHTGHEIYGTCWQYETHSKIKIVKHEDVCVQIDTLWHEWTHLLLWPRCKFRHSKAFWAQYGKIYSFYLDGMPNVKAKDAD